MFTKWALFPKGAGGSEFSFIGLNECAGLVISPKTDAPLRQLEFVPLGDGRSLVVMVSDTVVENRVIDLP